MTEEAKLRAYEAGQYACHVPPVCHALWDTHAWIRWIDACNGWRTP